MVTLPLDADGLKDFFSDKEAIQEIDYDASLAALGAPLAVLSYVANLDMVCNLHGDLSDELIELYMTHKKLTDIRNLQIIHANILYFAKYDEPLYPQTLDQFGPDRLAAFVAGHSELVKYHVAFMNSTQLYMYTQMEEKLKEKGEYQKTDQTFPQLGFALLRLFGLEEFMPIFLAKNPPLADQIYFVRYFEEPMFSGKPLYVHFHHENNMYAGLLLAVAQMDVEKLTQLQDELLSD